MNKHKFTINFENSTLRVPRAVTKVDGLPKRHEQRYCPFRKDKLRGAKIIFIRSHLLFMVPLGLNVKSTFANNCKVII